MARFTRCFCANVVIAHVFFQRNFGAPTSLGNFINSGTPANVTLKFDCLVRKYAYEYGKSMQPRHGNFLSLFDALQLHACNETRPSNALLRH